MEADEAKKIVESITDSITGGEKQECTFDIFIYWLLINFVSKIRKNRYRKVML